MPEILTFNLDIPQLDPSALLHQKLVEGDKRASSFCRLLTEHEQEKQRDLSDFKDFILVSNTHTIEYRLGSLRYIFQKKQRDFFDLAGVPEASTTQTKEIPMPNSKIILESSGKFKFFKANELFDENKIDKLMTFDKFKKIRKRKQIPIEDYLYKERYE